MSRVKRFSPLLVLVVALTWPLMTAAQDPTTCLEADGKCYVTNAPYLSPSPPRNGTSRAPWLVEGPNQDQDILDLRNTISEALSSNGYEGAFLAVIICQESSCQTTWYEYDRSGEEVDHKIEPGIPAELGVPLPFPFILVGGACLGTLLVGTGILLRRRARLLDT